MSNSLDASEGRSFVEAAREAARAARDLEVELQDAMKSAGKAGWSGYSALAPNFETLARMGLGDKYQSWVEADNTLRMAEAEAERWIRRAYMKGASPADIAESIGLGERHVRSVLAQNLGRVGSHSQWPFSSNSDELG